MNARHLFTGVVVLELIANISPLSRPVRKPLNRKWRVRKGDGDGINSASLIFTPVPDEHDVLKTQYKRSCFSRPVAVSGWSSSVYIRHYVLTLKNLDHSVTVSLPPPEQN